MDNDTNTDTKIKRVITCDIRWREVTNSYADLMISNGVCILGAGNRGTELFRSMWDGDLIALKDGINIIALGRPKLNNNQSAIIEKNTTWKGFFDKSVEPKLSDEQQEQKANYFNFSLTDKIDIIFIEKWVLLNTPIYYPVMQSTVTIRDKDVKDECIKRFIKPSKSAEEYKTEQINYYLENALHVFSQYTVISNDDVRKAPLSEELLNAIEIVLNYDPENKIAKTMKESISKNKESISKKDKIIEDKEIKIKSKELADTYNKKADSLKESNCRYIYFFIVILLSFAIISFNHIATFDINSIAKDNLIVFIVTKGIITSSMILAVFWIARFLNKRIHENVYLIEEYEYKALIFNSLQNLKDVFGEERADEVFQKIIEKIIENPAVNLIKIKDKKSDISLANIKEIAETLNEVKKVVNP